MAEARVGGALRPRARDGVIGACRDLAENWRKIRPARRDIAPPDGEIHDVRGTAWGRANGFPGAGRGYDIIPGFRPRGQVPGPDGGDAPRGRITKVGRPVRALCLLLKPQLGLRVERMTFGFVTGKMDQTIGIGFDNVVKLGNELFARLGLEIAQPVFPQIFTVGRRH